MTDEHDDESLALDYVNDLADPTILDRAITASGSREHQRDYIVAVDLATGRALDAWRTGASRRASYDSTKVAQYPVRMTNPAAARQHGMIIHMQRGK
jgi:hypothetical protein